MKYALLSDIHANEEAFLSVLRRCSELDIDEYVCLGDIVGYGASPRECIRIAKSVKFKSIVQGNHDFAITDKDCFSFFNSSAKEAVKYTRKILSSDDKAWLSSLPLKETIGDFIVTHSNPLTPSSWAYPILNGILSGMCLNHMKENLCFIGHSHRCGTMSMLNGKVITEYEVDVIPPEKCMINIGSVGQPRDGDNRASFAVYDSGDRTIVIHRVEYDYRTAANKIYEAGLPVRLGARLEKGE